MNAKSFYATLMVALLIGFSSLSAQNSDPNSASSQKDASNENFTDAKALVSSLLQTMVDGVSVNTKLRRYIAPSYYTKYSLDKEKYLIDNYTIGSYSVESYNSYSNLVYAKIWGKDKTWGYDLIFKIVEEYGGLYVYPQKHSDTYIKPWYENPSSISKDSDDDSFTSTGYEEKKLVEEILQIMVDQNSASTQLKPYIAPSYYTTYNLSKETYLIDNYSPKGYEIKSYNSSTGIINAEIWGNNRSWVHKLTFKLVKENGGLYVYPEKHSDSYIKPWYRVGAYIEEDNDNTLSSSGYEEKQMIDNILQIMVDQNSASSALKKYIAPSYYSTYSLSYDSYLIDNYSPVGYLIQSYSSLSGLVVAQIWGQDKGWVHELTFKIVKESGSLYVYPEKHSDSYIKPWYSVRAYIEENKNDDYSLSSSGYDEKEMVEEILQIMVDQNSASSALKKYIAPSYYSNNNLSKDSYLIDNYSPVGFTIKSYNSSTGLVVTEIWGKDEGWIHELTFKMVKEYGSLYVYPEKHSDSYIKPWYSVRTYIGG